MSAEMQAPNWMGRCAAGLALLVILVATPSWAAQASFQVSFPAAVESRPVTGRLIVFAAVSAEREPRKSIHITGPAIFGIDVENVAPGTTMTVDAKAAAYPFADLEKLPAGDYHVQALLIRYTQVRRSDGHDIWVPLPSSSYVHATQAPGNLYSAVTKIRLDATSGFTIPVSLTEIVPPLAPQPDTEWIKVVRIKSKLLSDFWGVPVYMGARVLLPRGFNEHPRTRYPGIYVFGHGTPFFFDPDPASHEPERASARDGNLQTGYEFYQTWISDGFPRVVAIAPDIPSPYFVESYSVNSANNGPWGDALTQELIPYIEKKFRLIAQPYARIVEGASTGGWETLALQLYYPELFGGAWVFNPDPIDFSRYLLSDIYQDENMFSIPVNQWISTERPERRTREGQPVYTVRQMAQLEAVLGSKGRSNYQFDIWQATHGPVGPDGYPVLLFDKKTGVINREVASYMREHGYDLSEYTRRNWSTLGPKLAGKLNFFAGEQDDFFLNLAVYKFEEMLKEMRNPAATARFEYGRPKKGHNWHLTDFSEMVREMAEYIKRTAPAGERSERWNY